MERLRILRKQRGLKQYEIAKMIGVGRTTYTKWETGERDPDTDTVIKLANLFDVSTDYLLGNSDDPTPPFKASETFYTVPMEPLTQKKEAPVILTETEHAVIDNFRSLNDEGQEKIIDYIDDLVTSGKYIKNNKPEMGSKKQA